MILQIVALAFGLAVFGAHPLLPTRLLPPEARRRAVALAVMLTIAALAAMFAATAEDPDAALAAGLGPGWPASTGGRLAAVLLLAALCSDALALSFAAGDEAAGRGVTALLGFGGLLGFALWGELLRWGEGPSAGTGLFWTAVLLRALVGLGAGEVLLPVRPRLAPLCALALLAYPLVLPEALRSALERGGDWLNLAAGAALLLLSRFLPGRLARLALAAAVLLAAIFFARTAQLSQQLGQAWPQLWQPPTGR